MDTVYIPHFPPSPVPPAPPSPPSLPHTPLHTPLPLQLVQQLLKVLSSQSPVLVAPGSSSKTAQHPLSREEDQLLPRHLPIEFYCVGHWDYLDIAREGTFPAQLDISIFILQKGADHRITPLAPLDGPSSSFVFLSRGKEPWTGDQLWDSILEQAGDHMEDWIGPTRPELLSSL